MQACALTFLFLWIGYSDEMRAQELSPGNSRTWLDAPPAESRISVTRLRHKPSNRAISAFKRGYQYAIHRNAKQAAAEFEQAVTLDPEFSEAHCDLGAQYVSLGDLEKAAAHYRRAIELDTTTSTYHSNLAVVLAMLHQYEPGKREALTAFRLDTSNAIAHYILGWDSMRRAQNLEEAIAHLEYAASRIREARDALAAARRKKEELLSAAQK